MAVLLRKVLGDAAIKSTINARCSKVHDRDFADTIDLERQICPIEKVMRLLNWTIR